MHIHTQHTQQRSSSLGGLTDRWDFVTDKTVLSSNWKHQTPVALIMTGEAALISAPFLNDSFQPLPELSKDTLCHSVQLPVQTLPNNNAFQAGLFQKSDTPFLKKKKIHNRTGFAHSDTRQLHFLQLLTCVWFILMQVNGAAQLIEILSKLRCNIQIAEAAFFIQVSVTNNIMMTYCSAAEMSWPKILIFRCKRMYLIDTGPNKYHIIMI